MGVNNPKPNACFSPITLGTVQLGIPYGIANRSGQPDELRSRKILDAAVEGGITSFDTAPTYGSSEQILGQYFSEFDSAPFIITKWGLHHGNSRLTEAELREQLDDMLKEREDRLKRCPIPALLLHTPLMLKEYGAEITRLLRERVQEGRIGKVGVSLGVHVDRELDELREIIEDDLYSIVQIPLNVWDQRLIRDGALKTLQSSGKLVLARSAYLQGLLLMDTQTLPRHLAEAAPWLAELHRLAEQEGLTVAEFCFSYVRFTTGVTSVLIGAETEEQVRENLQLLQVGPLREQTRERIQRVFADVPEELITPALWKA
ncbi:aldo/keto reductase [Paenibacillus cremeus]|uniref:Aldo/keto reductase n=1 Tax=Paenibacillus cremeus TaxID=2163881 RepID=A0A559K7E3_9BACL|nr:aldo/keto reductase [Paenibacillus cremeus]TVY08048.1 aldo/keto reductase [Paenibacillus cremeus]